MSVRLNFPVPDNTSIQVAYAKSTRTEARRWDFTGQPDRFTTDIELDGKITIDLAKPVYILQFDDAEESK